MAEPVATIVVLVANPALGSVLSMVLAADPKLRVRAVESEGALRTYMRLVPVDLLVADFDSKTARADQLAAGLRADPDVDWRRLQVIALASAVTTATKAQCIAAGIDEVLVKPMSPKYLLERVSARLARRAVAEIGHRPSRTAALASLAARRARAIAAPGSNVIPLFGRDPLPQH